MSKVTEIIEKLKAADKPQERYVKYQHLSIFAAPKDPNTLYLYRGIYIGSIKNDMFWADYNVKLTDIDEATIKQLLNS